MDTIISVQSVTKQFKTQTVLNNVSVDFPSGSIYGLVGRNGSGKTMLMKCICGFVPPTRGKIFVQGKQVRYGSQFPKGIGFIIESPGFLRNSSGFANLMSLASINRKIGLDEVKDAMILVGLDPYSKKHVGRYSLGMRQRLGIAQAIMEHPDILILDEPMNGLDNNGVDEMRKLFLKLKGEGKTLIIASHNHEDIEVLCDKVYEMDNGSLSG
ncbi:ATP-binding cassette domain-containing protein [Anaerocolumna sp. AGMB13025]|uniref:ATP-binding cassette domain-containing protein n=1 Tax=Anaerocolumna sp. AGMB13025 TaxID=3039116 RepID=UPI00241EE1B8|nr:ATP-binding cassette domain-containing protein [Anaerocolumna sp. AGMB13025]WFR57533.1 ATP-binding cassette domain-containing protein [Anaerocolumna sp. AGMB13025]